MGIPTRYRLAVPITSAMTLSLRIDSSHRTVPRSSSLIDRFTWLDNPFPTMKQTDERKAKKSSHEKSSFQASRCHCPDFPSVLHIVMSRIISDSGLHVRITDDISILGFPDGLQIQLVLIANAVDGHRMRNQVPSIGWIQARYTQH